MSRFNVIYVTAWGNLGTNVDQRQYSNDRRKLSAFIVEDEARRRLKKNGLIFFLFRKILVRNLYHKIIIKFVNFLNFSITVTLLY